MNQEVAYELGRIETFRRLKTGTYISPSHTLSHTSYPITPAEEHSYIQGCIQAVNEYINENT
jgi:hypothetical protein